jgi:hypothetical protein
VLVHSDLEELDGSTRKLTNAEIGSFVTLLSIAGTETVARLLSWAAVLLARNPDQRKILVDDPTVIPNGIEEMLRYEAPSPVNAAWLPVGIHTDALAGVVVAMLSLPTAAPTRRTTLRERRRVRRGADRPPSCWLRHALCGAALAVWVASRSRPSSASHLGHPRRRAEWVHTSTVRSRRCPSTSVGHLRAGAVRGIRGGRYAWASLGRRRPVRGGLVELTADLVDLFGREHHERLAGPHVLGTHQRCIPIVRMPPWR